MCSFTFALSEKVYVSIVRRLNWFTFRTLLLWGVGLFILAIMVIASSKLSGKDWATSYSRELTPLIFAFAVGCVFSGIYGLWRTPSLARSMFRETPLIGLETAFRVGDDGLNVSNDRENWNLAWDDVLQWRQLRDHLIIYITRVNFFALPISALGAAGVELVVGRLVSSGLPKQGKKRKK